MDLGPFPNSLLDGDIGHGLQEQNIYANIFSVDFNVSAVDTQCDTTLYYLDQRSMTSQPEAEAEPVDVQPRRRRSTRQYPVLKFEDVLLLPQTILDHGANGQLRRLTVFDRLERSPDSGTSRQLVTTCSRYGLTSGGYTAEYVTITEVGKRVLETTLSEKAVLSAKFECAIEKFDVFRQVYENLVSQRMPANDVLTDIFRQVGLSDGDRQPAADIFVANLKYLGLVRQISGTERVISLDQRLEEMSTSSGASQQETPPDHIPTNVEPQVNETGRVFVAPNRPALHIDIQVHIDPTTSPEIIDQIFASMAKHLYGNE